MIQFRIRNHEQVQFLIERQCLKQQRKRKHRQVVVVAVVVAVAVDKGEVDVGNVVVGGARGGEEGRRCRH